ncbi:MAG: hypothetical protein JWR69_930, partial [Pedosphaera sp.]|nr:hypothetical protein [Pedosphaera sp.]
GVCPRIVLFSSATNQFLIGGTFPTESFRLRQHDSDPELVAPALALNLGDTNFNTRHQTQRALAAYGIKDTNTPALLEYLNDSTLHVRMAATNALKTLDPVAGAKAGIK